MATVVARILRRSDALRAITGGYFAHRVVVRGDPLEDITVLRAPVVVIQDGVVVVDRR